MHHNGTVHVQGIAVLNLNLKITYTKLELYSPSGGIAKIKTNFVASFVNVRFHCIRVKWFVPICPIVVQMLLIWLTWNLLNHDIFQHDLLAAIILLFPIRRSRNETVPKAIHIIYFKINIGIYIIGIEGVYLSLIFTLPNFDSI